MKMKPVLVLLVALLLCSTGMYAQYDPAKVCRLDDGTLVFVLDKRWTASQRTEVSGIFNLDSLLMVAAFSGKQQYVKDEVTWTIRKIDANRVELRKSAEKKGGGYNRNDLTLVDDVMIRIRSESLRESVPYGVNRLTRNTIVQLYDDRMRFFLAGYRDANHVYLSGSFNNWSTLQNPMQKVDSGWMITLKLQPGKYTYKYIIDGKWTPDVYNRLREDDTYHGQNSVFFVYNHRFVLDGYEDARKVVVAGSFNHWNRNELRMIRFRGQWVLPAYIREGTHAYKFIVDDHWMKDPACKVNRPDGRGNENSFFSIGDTMYFTLPGYQDAKKIALAGNFNAWNSGELFMIRTGNGWQLPYVLGPGTYEYKYIVDGKWMIDPANPNTTGSGEFTNSILTVEPNFVFTLKGFTDASQVTVSGSFNGWNRIGYRMVRKDGAWTFATFLRPGKYTYKFIVDGKWILDPANDLWEENEYGTGNSVLWIEP